MSHQRRKRIIRLVLELLDAIGYGRWRARGFPPKTQANLERLYSCALEFLLTASREKRIK